VWVCRRALRGELVLSSSRVEHPVSPEGVSVDFAGNPIAPDGKLFAARGAGGKVTIFAPDGGTAREIQGLEPSEVPLAWSGDGQSLFVWSRGELPARVLRIDLATATHELWRELRPEDLSGLVGILAVNLTPDGRSYAYTCDHRNAELYIAERLR
jgi:hypothetical protein